MVGKTTNRLTWTRPETVMLLRIAQCEPGSAFVGLFARLARHSARWRFLAQSAARVGILPECAIQELREKKILD